MELAGAWSNRSGAVELSKADQLRLALLRRSSGSMQPRVFEPNRPTPIRVAVLAVLIEASGALRAVEVRYRVEQRLGQSVSWSSVRNALVDLAGQDGSGVDRGGCGRYRFSLVDGVDTTPSGWS